MSIAERITSMSNNLSSAYDGIEYLGVDITGVDKNLQNLSSMLNVVYEGLPKVSDEGISPSIVGSRVGRLKSTLKASDTTQNSTTGKNLLPYPYKNTTKTDSGITWTDNNDGTITVDGTNNSSSTVYFTCVGYSSPFGISLIAGTYTISLGVASNVRCTCAEYGNIQNVVALINAGSSKTTFTLSGDKVVTFALAVNAGLSVDNVKIRPMLASGTDDTYEPYTGGIPSPNPNYPQDIHVVKGNNTVEVCGKNLWSSEWEQGGISNSNGQNTTSSVSVRTKGYISVQPNQHYSIQRSIATDYIMVRGYSKNKTFLGTGNDVLDLIYGQTSGNPMRTGDSNCIISPKEGVYYLRIVENSNDLSTQYMMVKGDYQSGLVYEQYTGTTYPINLGDIELCKISTYQYKLFKAISGDVVYDSLTAEQKAGLVSGGWYKYGEVGKVVLDGVNTKFSQKSASTANVIWMTTADYDISNHNTNIICNYFKKVTSNVIYNTSMLGVYTENKRIKCGFGIDTQLTTLELANEWLKTHNVIVYLPYGEPQIIPITDTTLISQLENLYNAMSKNGQTNILQTNADNPFIIYASALKGG